MHILVFGGKKTRFGRLIAVLLIFAVAVPLITHYQLGRHDTDDAFFPGPFMSRTQKASHSEETLADYAELLKKEVEELKRIKRSLSNELRALEGSRAKVQRDIQKFGEKADYARSQAEKLRAAVSRAERDLEMIKLAKKEATDCPQLPHLKLPMRLMADSLNVGISPSDEELSSMCDLNTCFDFSRCSYSSGFPLYIYDPMVNGVGSTVEESNSIADFIKKGPHHVSDASKACLFIVVAGTVQESDAVKIERQLHSLPYWGKNGQNHVILQINMADSLSSNPPTDISSLNISCGLASLGQSSFHGRRSYRQGFDLILPPIQRMLATENIWEIAALQLPASRKYLLSFQGTQRNFEGKIFPEELKELGEEAEDIFIETTCQIEPANDIHNGGVWSLCGSHGDRIEVLRQSMFTLVLGRSEIGASWSATLVRLVEALQAGAIPVVLAGNIPLPFNDLIMWTEAAIVLPPARITELNVLLRTVGNADILSMRRQGRFLWESYFSSGTALAETALAVFRSRLKIPAPPMAVAHTTSVFTDENRPVINPADPAAIIQLARPSPSFTRNLTVTTVDSYRLWNSPPGPFGLYPSSPFDPVFPSSAPFYQSAKGFDLIGKGEGGSGKEFSQSLGGNYPKDQFTVVMLTYERELVLMEALQRLVGLQYLNRVVVIWNSPNPPAPSLRWPNIGVPLHVIKVAKNSLNNRFIPFDVIETDAIFSLDDDVALTHEEILLAFRVWRESRDRLVGLPGRYHAWDVRHGGWLYQANVSCELSMILTGAAFFHRYYSHLYTQWMPKVIRDKVDEFMNCEDLAMNFLISHIARKPPIKVTSRWTFKCPSCKRSLWEDSNHSLERHQCLNFFAKVFGYMPLLRTQFRADSVLFKTRIPSDKTKCFRSV